MSELKIIEKMKRNQPRTLGDYRELAVFLGGEDNHAVRFFDERIACQGADMQVLADEGQMLLLIQTLFDETDAKAFASGVLLAKLTEKNPPQ
jgi:methionine synthase I (cobalamin-dependent)